MNNAAVQVLANLALSKPTRVWIATPSPNLPMVRAVPTNDGEAQLLKGEFGGELGEVPAGSCFRGERQWSVEGPGALKALGVLRPLIWGRYADNADFWLDNAEAA